MDKLIEWVGQFEQKPLTILLGVVLASAWMTEMHLTISQTAAAVTEVSKKVELDKAQLMQDLSQERRLSNELLRSIDQRLSRIEGKLEK